MLKQIRWKLVFKFFAWVITLGGIVALMSFVSVKKQSVKCTNIKILIPGADNFIEREEIDAILKQNEGQLIGRNLEGINLHTIEEKIKSNPYIALSTVYADMDGVIHIEINQRQPLLRIINLNGQDFYIDNHGLKMPVSSNFTANVLVANGKILEHFTGKVDTLITRMAADLYKTALFLKKDSLWDSQIEQIFVNDKDDIEFIPRVGNQRIILGNADSLEIKMSNLLTFYKKAMPKVGWDTYKTINIKYTNQIVCEKSNIDSLSSRSSGTRAVRPTPLTVRRVMDSIVKAQIAAELKNNPEFKGSTSPANEANTLAEKKPAVVQKTVAVKKSTVPKKAAVVHKPEEKKPVAKKPAAEQKPVVAQKVVPPVAKPAKSGEATKKTDKKKLIPEKK